ncbi:hypothetical protein ACSSS7_000243 [Eimeria intestinalis]
MGLKNVGRKMSLTRRSTLSNRRSSAKKVMSLKGGSDEEGWIREKGKYLDLSYRVEKDTSVSIKVRGKLPCPLFQVLSILNESDLAGYWAPMFKSAEKVYVYSRAAQLIRQIFDYPVLGAKETIMFSFGINALEECGAVIICCRSPPEDATEFMGKAIPPKGKVPRIQSANLVFLLYPISEGKQTTLELYGCFAHGLRYVPTRIITYVVKKVVRGMFVSIAKQCQHFSTSVYKQRIDENPEFYCWMRECIEDFVAGGPPTVAPAAAWTGIMLCHSLPLLQDMPQAGYRSCCYCASAAAAASASTARGSLDARDVSLLLSGSNFFVTKTLSPHQSIWQKRPRGGEGPGGGRGAAQGDTGGFAETICSYEEEVRHLKEAVAAAQQQLKAAGAAAAAAAAARGSNSQDAAKGVGGGFYAHAEGSEDKSGAAAAAAAESASAGPAAAHDTVWKAAAAAAGSAAGRKGGSPGAFLPSPSCRSLASSRSLSDRQTQHDDTDDAAEIGGSRPGSSRAWATKKGTRSVTRLPSPSETAHLAAGGGTRLGAPGFFARKQTAESLDGDRFSGGKMHLVSDYMPAYGASSGRSSRTRGRCWGALEGGPQGAPSSAVWVDSILPDWEAQRETAAFDVLLQRGVPHDVRGEVWKRAVGDQLRLTPQYYELLVARMANARSHLLKTNRKYRERIEGIGGPLLPQSEAPREPVAAAARGAPLQHESKPSVCSLCGAPVDEAGVASPPGGPLRSNSNSSSSISSSNNSSSSSISSSNNSSSSSWGGCGGEGCCFKWEDEVFGSFLAISADLHRTLPRLGLVDSRPPLHADSSKTPAAAASSAAAAAAAVAGEGHPIEKETPQQDAAHAQEASGADATPAGDTARTSAAPSSAAGAAAAEGSSSDSSKGASVGGVAAAPDEVDAEASACPAHPAKTDLLPANAGAPCEGPFPAAESTGKQREGSGFGGPSGGGPQGADVSSRPDSQAVAPLPFGVAGGEKMECFLQTVLECFVMLRPDIGYVQGMAFIAAALLLYMDEYSAFVCFANLMESAKVVTGGVVVVFVASSLVRPQLRRSLHAFYTFDMPAVEVYFRSFDALLEERHPLLLQHLQDLGIQTDVFLVDWMYTIFTRCFLQLHAAAAASAAAATAAAVAAFAAGAAAVPAAVVAAAVVEHREPTSLAIVSYFREELEVGTLDECMAILSPSTTTRFQAIQADKFLDLLFGTRLTSQRFDALMVQVQKTLSERKRKQGPQGLPLRHFNSEVGTSNPPSAAGSAAGAAVRPEAAGAAAAAAAPAAAGAAAARAKEGCRKVLRAPEEKNGEQDQSETEGGPPGRLRRRSFTWSVEGPPSACD